MMTVTSIVTLGGPIPATVGTFETQRKHEEPKVTTVTRMAALRRRCKDRDLQDPVLVTVASYIPLFPPQS